MIEQLKEILEKALPGTDASKVTEDTVLSDELGFDSMALMMMSMHIEDTFGFKFEEFIKFRTAGEVIKYIEEHKKTA